MGRYSLKGNAVEVGKIRTVVDEISPESRSTCASSCQEKSPYSYIFLLLPMSYHLVLVAVPVCAVELAVFLTSSLTVSKHYVPGQQK